MSVPAAASPSASGGSAPRAWLLAARPNTLPASVAPVLVGAAASGAFRPLPFVATLAAAVLIQVGVNLANDVQDFHRGADTDARLGPTRVTQAGLLAPRRVAAGAGVALATAVLIGVYLVFVAGWPILAIGITSVVCAWAYSGGPFPLAYRGLGDLFVFVYFGLFAVGGAAVIQRHGAFVDALPYAVPMGCLVTAILVVNNLRDRESDRRSGKYTLAVRLGERGTIVEYGLLLAVAFAAPPVLWAAGYAPAGVWLTWLSLPLAVTLLRGVVRVRRGRELNRMLKNTARLDLLFAVLLAVGLVL